MKKTTKLLALPVMASALFLSASLTWASSPPFSILKETIQTEANAQADAGEYSINVWGNGDCAITGYSGSGTDLIIPSELDGHPVKEIAANAFRGNSSIQSVTLPDTLETVGEKAFYECSALTKISLNEGLTSIGADAFSGCRQLMELSFPTTLETVGERAFESCEALKDIDFSKADQLKTLSTDVFYTCSSLEQITLPQNLEEVGCRSFGKCTNLREVKFPEGLKKIKRTAFWNCPLQALNLPDSVTEIGEMAFHGGRFTEVRLPKSWCKSVPERLPFESCPIASIEIPDGMKVIPARAFGYSYYDHEEPDSEKNVKTLSFPASLTSIEDNAFSALTMLEEIRIYKSAVAIKNYAFDVNSVKEAWLGWRLDSIADDAFKNRHNAFTICGASGSYAQTYADKNGINFEAKDIDLNNCSLALSSNSLVYDGTAKEPAFTIAGAEEELLEFMGCEPGVNYNVSYKDNVNAGTASVTVTAISGRGYTGSCTASFTIEPRPISDSQAEFGAYNKIYDGTAKEPSIQLTCGGATLQAGQDYSLIGYEHNIQAGTASVKVEGTGNYTGQHAHTFTIDPKPLENGWITLSPAGFTYDGTAKEPVVTVTDGQISFIQNKDYEVSYQGNLHVGEASATVTGIGNYAGEFTYTYKIKPKNLSEEMIQLSPNSFVYDGTVKEPQITVIDNGAVLEAGTAYTVKYQNNTEKGTAQAVVTGTGDYTGEVSIPFTIGEITAELSETVYTYDGSEKKPTVTVKKGSQTLQPGTDYQIDYQDNTNAGTAKVLLSGSEINMTLNFTILRANITKLRLLQTDFTYDGTPQTPAIEVLSGETLLTADEYEMDFQDNLHAGTAKAIVDGIGNYSGHFECDYEIKAKPLEDSMIHLSQTNYTYDGTAKEPQVAVTDNGVVLEAGTAYTVEYQNNTEKGTARAVITGMGDYMGEAFAAFTIGGEPSDQPTTQPTTPSDRPTTQPTTPSDQPTAWPTDQPTREITAELSQQSYTYDGSEKRPETIVKIDGALQQPGSDYQVEYQNNVNAGTAAVVLSGSKINTTLNFAILPAPLTDFRLTPTEFFYDGTPKIPPVEILSGETILTLDTDYTLSYTDNVDVGTATVTAAGMGNYTGTLQGFYTISAINVPEKETAQITLSKKTYRIPYDAKPFALNASLKGDGALSYSTDNPAVAAVSPEGTVSAKRPGIVVITIRADETENYSAAEADVTVSVTPKKAKIKKIQSQPKKLKIFWKKDAKANGYQILTAADKNFTKQKSRKTIRQNASTSAIVKKLKPRKTYYVKVRSYTIVNGKKIYGTYSKVAKKKTK